MVDPPAALELLVPVIQAATRTAGVEQADGDLRTTAPSAFFGFADDLERYANSARGLLQARSPSRLGVNSHRLKARHQVLPG